VSIPRLSDCLVEPVALHSSTKRPTSQIILPHHPQSTPSLSLTTADPYSWVILLSVCQSATSSFFAYPRPTEIECRDRTHRKGRTTHTEHFTDGSFATFALHRSLLSAQRQNRPTPSRTSVQNNRKQVLEHLIQRLVSTCVQRIQLESGGQYLLFFLPHDSRYQILRYFML
jgi:hypothetical protein